MKQISNKLKEFSMMTISTVYRAAALLLAILCLTGLLSGCGGPDADPSGDYTAPAAETAGETGQSISLDIKTVGNRQDELVFDISPDDYIDAYNALYRGEKGGSYLLPRDRWDMEICDTAIHSGHRTALYTFAEDKSILTIPTITVYTPPDSGYITEITVNFDDHGYSEQLYDLYDEMCLYTLKVFLPGLSDGQLVSLRDTVNESAYEDWFRNEDGYRYGSVPNILYHRGGVGVYPYFALGEYVHFCIVPVDEAMLDGMREKGVDVREIE